MRPSPAGYSRSVKENILYGKLDASDSEVKKAVSEAHFEKDLQMLPAGLETMVGEKGVALSYKMFSFTDRENSK